ncbi:MAG TPA: UDP-N-acetylenolpyruvoylglucosamine reductase [Acidimicrobium sp.]|jgi:UDP-N-acetylmuramate dehydrogenase|nr:UDP-N-acetylenolpyruvoylglucosamine reductase [Acidimicrobium sp.]
MNSPRSFKRPATDAELRLARELFGKRVHVDVSLAQFTTYRVGGNAALHIRVESIDDLVAISAVLAQVDLPVLVIGRGSNMLIADTGFQGLAITFGSFLEYIDLPDRSANADDKLDVEPIALFGGSVLLPVAARQSVHRGLTGFEWGVGVPGTIGGAVRMNAGGHGSDIASSLVSARIFHLLRGVEAHVDAVDLGLRFRGSAIADHHVVLSATLNLSWSTATEKAENQVSEIVKWRRENQPGGQNAGSVFVNPVPGEVSAGALIDQIGMRGFRIGTAHISEKHANFIQAEEGGLASDVVRVMAEIRRRVKESTGYDLRSEIRLAGFDPTMDPSLVEVLTSESDTSVATVRLEHIFDRNANTSVSTDTSIPISVLTSTSFRDALDVPTEVLDELRTVFNDGTSDTQEQPVVASVTDIRTREVTMPVEPPATESTAAPDRVVIVDEDFRQPSESDFPSDTASESVHQAPTSLRVLITDDDVAQDLNAEIIVGTQWRDTPRSRKLLGLLTGKFVGGNKRKRLVMTGLGVVVAIGVALIILASPIVAVKTVRVEGAKYADSALVRSVSDSLKGKSVLTVDTKTAQERLESDPWIKSARITTSLPSRVLIQINERIPVAWFLGVDNRARVIDEDGLVLSVVEGRPTQYMWIEGTGPNLTAGASSAAAYRAAGQLAMSLPSELAPMVKHLGVAGTEEITMTLKTGTVVNFGAPVDMRNKLVNVVVLLRRQDVNSIISIDVSTGTPVVQS